MGARTMSLDLGMPQGPLGLVGQSGHDIPIMLGLSCVLSFPPDPETQRSGRG